MVSKSIGCNRICRAIGCYFSWLSEIFNKMWSGTDENDSSLKGFQVFAVWWYMLTINADRSGAEHLVEWH